MNDAMKSESLQKLFTRNVNHDAITAAASHKTLIPASTIADLFEFSLTTILKRKDKT